MSIGGWGAGAKANLFMDALHAADELQLIIHSMQGGERRLVFQLVEFGGVSWNPSPDAATLVEIPVRGEAAHTYFEGERMVYTTAGSGRVVVPYAGDVESWPTLTLPAGARFKLREEDQWQTAPGGGEWVAYTDPAERRIEVGGQPAPGLVAFWPQPPKRVPGGVEMWIDSKTDVTVEMTERWRKGWA